MKQLKLAVIALFALVTVSNLSAQDSDNPWAVSFGVNAIDRIFYDSYFKDLGGVDTDLNILPSLSRITVEKYISDGFTIQFAGSLNSINDWNDGNNENRDVDFLYWSLGANVKYDLNNLVGDTSQYFDPFVYLGGAYVDADFDSEGMLAYGLGFNTWFNDNLGISFQSGEMREFADKVNSHWQHAIGLVIKFGGKDTDGDGVYDKYDECLDVAGLEEFNGCPDSDGDGIKDADDACPNTVGIAELNGCPDADEDGIADKDDMCPNDKGTKANNGCPDSDGDGVVDKDDKCPTESGPSANGGCSWSDTDGDGVLDKDDNCKDEVGPASNNGCPEPVITEISEEKIKEFAKSIYFNTNSAVFRPQTEHKLDGIVSIMKEFPKANFFVEGHTDNTGTEEYNMKLSVRRAEAVRKYFISKGISESRLESKGFGESNPIDTNNTRAGKKNNRRVEIEVTNK